jgi:hypothetical protein
MLPLLPTSFGIQAADDFLASRVSCGEKTPADEDHGRGADADLSFPSFTQHTPGPNG